MLTPYNPVDVHIALTQAAPKWPPFPPITDREAWQQVAEHLGEEETERRLATAEAAAAEPIPPLPATLFLEFQRTGQREGYQTPRARRRTMLQELAIAECLENQGRFLDAILNVAWAICEESSWVLPAHQGVLTDIHHPVIDLGAASTGLELAELDAILGATIDPALRKRIRDEVDRRLFTPYLTRHDHWWLHNTRVRTVNNWTAVCNAGVVGAALYLEQDEARLAEIIARAARSLDDYLSTFDEDGGSSEGPGYWGYGFGHYALLSHLIEERSAGEIRFLDGPYLRKIARFPAATVLSPGSYVNFSDCDADVVLEKSLLAYLARRVNLPELRALASAQSTDGTRRDLSWELRRLFWRLPMAAPEPFIPARHEWYGGMMWMISRYDPSDPQALVLAAKGGHNGEMHNQNDVGTFIVHVKQESVIPDVGRGRYTKDYFRERRYEHFVNSSFGHSVPVANGQLQQAGKEFGAALLEHSTSDATDILHLELAGAYPPASDLESLQRRFVFHRDPPGGWITLEDRVRFRSGPAPFESVLITFGQVELGVDALVIRGVRGKVRVGFDDNLVTPRVELHQGIDMPHGPMDVRRIVFALSEPLQEAAVRLEIEPVE